MEWNQNLFIQDRLTILSEGEAAYSLREAWKKIHNSYPSNATLACLWAQTALETGKFKLLHVYNWGNIKSRPDDGHYWTAYKCSEIINGKEIFFTPPHPQCNFRAYKTSTDGAEDYIKFLTKSRYAKSLTELKKGNVVTYTQELSKAGYFTASVSLYLKGMTRLVNEFNKKQTSLLSWKPQAPVEIPIMDDNIFTPEERKEIMSKISIGVDSSIYDYFSKSNRYEENDSQYYSVNKKSFWQTIKNKLGF